MVSSALRPKAAHLVSLAAGLLASLALAAPVAAAVTAAAAPQLTLSRFEPMFVAIRPYALLALVAYGLYVAFLVLVGRIKAISPGRDGSTPTRPSITEAIHVQLYIGAVIVLAVVLLYAGIDILNAVVAFVWSVFA